jgi:hypothetical protein
MRLDVEHEEGVLLLLLLLLLFILAANVILPSGSDTATIRHKT